MSKVRIEIDETDGLNASNHTLYVELPETETAGSVGGPRSVLIDHETKQELHALLKHACLAVNKLRPTILNLTIKFYEP